MFGGRNTRRPHRNTHLALPLVVPRLTTQPQCGLRQAKHHHHDVSHEYGCATGAKKRQGESCGAGVCTAPHAARDDAKRERAMALCVAARLSAARARKEGACEGVAARRAVRRCAHRHQRPALPQRGDHNKNYRLGLKIWRAAMWLLHRARPIFTLGNAHRCLAKRARCTLAILLSPQSISIAIDRLLSLHINNSH